MNGIDSIIDNWYIILGIVILGLFYWRITKNTNEIEKKTQMFYLHMGIVLLVCFIIQKFVFPQHYYFLIAMPIFIPCWVIFIKWLLSRDDVYILESCIQGEKFYDLKNVKMVIAENTSQRLLIMPREIYDSKIHVGDLHYGFWAGSSRIKFCDKYDDETGIFFHPPIQQLHNYTFYAIKSFWLKMKNDLPHIIDTNTVLTLMSDWYLSFKMFEIRENMDVHLKSLNNQHCKIPFTMPDNLEQLYNKAVKDKTRDISPGEKEISTKNIDKSEPKESIEPKTSGGESGK